MQHFGLPPETSFTDLDSALGQHSKQQPIILDFDGTLLLRNSTEIYLESAWPRPVAALLLASVDFIKPWRVLPGNDRDWLYSDWVRVVVVTLLLPWSALLWRRGAAQIARRHANAALLQRIMAWRNESLFVATFGFRFVVAPLLRAMAPEVKLAVASSFLTGFQLRRIGKVRALTRAVGADALSGSLVITDSTDDAELDAVAARLILIDCPPDAHRRAFEDCYIPFRYLHRVKRPDENHFVRQILYHDLWILWLSYAWQSQSPLQVAGGLLFLQLSYWIIYEIGYWENDVLGSRYEEKPMIRDGFAEAKDHFDPSWAWSFSLLLAMPGVALLDVAGATHIVAASMPVPLSFAAIYIVWTIYLCAMRYLYWMFNRIDVKSRVFLYPALQLTKHLGFVVMLPISAVGAVLCGAVTLARWMPYIFYRYGGHRWETPWPLFQIGIFNLLGIVMTLGAGRNAVLVQPEFWFVNFWLGFHARRQMAALLRGVVWLPSRARTASPNERISDQEERGRT